MLKRHLDPKISVSIVFVAALFMSIMDTTIVNVALPSIARQLHVTSTATDAVVVSYLVSLAVIIPSSGWLGDRLGTKRVLLAALALFCVASALCGLASNLVMLVVFRVLQGAAGGALTPVGTAMLYRTFPPAERVKVSSILNIPTILAPASGPVIGGLLVDQLSWRWVFYVNIPIGLAAFIFGLLFLPEHREPETGRFDLAGFVLAGAGLALVLYALSEGATIGWMTFSIVSSTIIGLLALTAFVFVELRTPKPMLDLRLFKDRLFLSSSVSLLFTMAAFSGILYALPLFLQEARGVSALVSGLTTFPEAIGVVVATQIIARFYRAIGPRRIVCIGLIFMALFMALLALVSLDTNLWLIRLLMFLIGSTVACAFLPIQTAAFATISSAATGQASALYNVQRQLGAALGVAVLTTVIVDLSSSSRATLPGVNAYHGAFLAAALLALIASAIASTIRDRDAAATMHKDIAQETQNETSQDISPQT
jgi:EmrB/QacA subfamily drug resistance transporter